MEVTWLLALVSIPIYFNIYTSRVFEPDKITLFRSLMLVLGVAWLGKGLASWAVDRQQARATTTAPTTRRSLYSSSRPAQVEAEEIYGLDGEVMPPDPRPFPRNFLRRPLVLPALVLVFVYVLATILSVVPGASWWGSYQRLQGTYTLCSYLILFLAIVFNLREKRQIERLISFVLLTNIPVALYGFLQHYKADPLPWQGDVTFRVTSTMGNAIFIAAYLITVVPLILYRLIMTGHWLVVNRQVAKRSFKGRSRDNALSWFALYACFVLFEVGLFFAVLNYAANYRPDQSNGGVAQAAAPQLIDSSKRAVEFNQLLTGESGPWWALPVGILLTFGLYFLFTVRRNGTDNNYLFRIFEMVGYLGLGVITILTLLYSQSRGPLLGIMVALFFFPPILFWRRKLWKWLGGWLAIGLLAGGILFLFNQPIGTTVLEPAFKVARQNPQIARLGQFLEANDGTGRVRQLIWKTDFEIMGNALKNEPYRFFIGYGPESLYNISPPFYQPELARVEARNAIPDRSHNGYLDALVTTGLIGLLSYVGLVIIFFYYAFRFLRRTNRLDYQVLLTALICLMLAHQIEIQTGIQIVASWMMFWTAAGLVIVLGGFITGGYGRAVTAIVEPEPVVATPILIEELEPVAVSVATTAGTDKNGKASGKQKARNGQAVVTNLAQNQAKTEVESRIPIRNKVVSTTSTRRNRNSMVGSGRGTPPLAAATAGAFGIGGNPLYYRAAYFSQAVRPWFWVGLGGLGLLALVYAYFANFLPISADAYYKQGSNYAAAQRWSIARPYFQEAINAAPGEDFYYLFLGQAYLEEARALISDQSKRNEMVTAFTNGEQALLKSHDIAPLNPDHYANLARLYALWASADPTRTEELLAKSVTWYDQVTATRAPRNARLWAEKGAAYLNLAVTRRNGPDQNLINRAIEAGQQSVKIDDAYDFNRLILGDIYLTARQPENAAPQYLKLAELNIGQLAGDAKYDERVRTIAASQQIATQDLTTTFGPKPTTKNGDLALQNATLGAIYLYRGVIGEAEAKLNNALAFDRTNPFIPAYLALVKARQNRPAEATKYGADALALARQSQENSQLQGAIQQLLSANQITVPASATQSTSGPAGPVPTTKP